MINLVRLNLLSVSSSVARNVLDRKRHKVDLGGECRITVEARPVHLMLPGLVEVKKNLTR